MKIAGRSAIPARAEAVRAYTGAAQSAAVRPEQSASRFDQFTSSGESGRSSFEMELRGRIFHDVRTATSSGMVSSLREELRSGAYQVDAGAVARKMLLMEEDA